MCYLCYQVGIDSVRLIASDCSCGSVVVLWMHSQFDTRTRTYTYALRICPCSDSHIRNLCLHIPKHTSKGIKYLLVTTRTRTHTHINTQTHTHQREREMAHKLPPLHHLTHPTTIHPHPLVPTNRHKNVKNKTRPTLYQ